MLQSVIVALTDLFVPLVAVISLLGVAFAIVARLTSSPPTQGSTAFLFSFGFLGGVTGLIAGVSRESIVGGLLTGLLGIISALLSYLFGKESLKQWRHYIPFAIMLLVISALAGLSIGGIYKNRFEDFDRAYKRSLLEYEKVHLEVQKEESLLQLREQYQQDRGKGDKETPTKR